MFRHARLVVRRVFAHWTVLLAVLFAIACFAFVSYRYTPQVLLPIAVLTPLTGEHSREGNEHLRAALLAVETLGESLPKIEERLNQAGVRRTEDSGCNSAHILRQRLESLDLRISAYDSQTSTQLLADRIRRQDSEERKAEDVPLVVAGFHFTHDVIELTTSWQTGIDYPFLLLSTVTTEQGLVPPQLGVSRVTYGCRYSPTNSEIASAMVHNIPRTQPRTPSHVAISVVGVTAYARELANCVRENWNRPDRGQIVEVHIGEQAVLGDPLPDSIHNQLTSMTPPEVSIYFCCNHREAIYFLSRLSQQVSTRSSSPPFPWNHLTLVGSESLFTRDFLCAADVHRLLNEHHLVGQTFLISLLEHIPPQETAAFRTAFQRRFGEPPDGYGILTYRALQDTLCLALHQIDPQAANSPGFLRELRSALRASRTPTSTPNASTAPPAIARSPDAVAKVIAFTDAAQRFCPPADSHAATR